MEYIRLVPITADRIRTFVVLSGAKDHVTPCKVQVLRFAQDDSTHIRMRTRYLHTAISSVG